MTNASSRKGRATDKRVVRGGGRQVPGGAVHGTRREDCAARPYTDRGQMHCGAVHGTGGQAHGGAMHGRGREVRRGAVHGTCGEPGVVKCQILCVSIFIYMC